MMRNYVGTDTVAGELAKNIEHDENFPHNPPYKLKAWHDIILKYLYECDADSKYIDVFEKCWQDYEAKERKWYKEVDKYYG
jgi:uncharacterized protein YozE (UPF0346 family)